MRLASCSAWNLSSTRGHVGQFVTATAGHPEDRVQIVHDAYRSAMESDEFGEHVQQFAALRQYRRMQEVVDQRSEDFDFYNFTEELGWGG